MPKKTPQNEWDVAFRKANKHGTIEVTIPVDIARALAERSYNRAKVTITNDGILFTPYQGEEAHVELPDWG